MLASKRLPMKLEILRLNCLPQCLAHGECCPGVSSIVTTDAIASSPL